MNIVLDFFVNPWNLAVIIIGLSLSIVLWIKGQGALSLRGYIPTLWTSLGILGTFTAIYIGLSDYSTANGVPELNKLIEKVIPAFSTSIIGIIGAIISTIINRWANDNAEREDYEQFVKIKNKIPGQKILSSSPEMVLLEIISAIRETSNRTCEKLRNNTDTSGKKLEQINSRLSTIDTTVSAVGDRIKGAITECLNKQREEFSAALSLLISTLSSELKSQTEGMANKMDDLRRMLHDEVEHIESTNQNLLTQLIKQEETLLNLTTQTLLKDSETRNKSLQDFITKQTDGLEETFSEITAGMGALYQKIEESITYHINEEKSLFEHEIKESIEEFANTQYTTCSETISKCNVELASHVEKLHQSHVQSTTEFISKLDSIFSRTCEDFKVKMDSLCQGLNSKLEEINNANIISFRETIEENQQLIQSILDHHSKGLDKTFEHIEEEDLKFKQAIVNEHQIMQKSLMEQFGLFLVEIQKAMAETRNILESNSQSTSQISTSISQTLINLGEEVHKSNLKFLANIESLKTQIVGSAENMSIDIQRAIANSSQIKQLESMAMSITSAIDKTIKSMNQEMTKVSSVINSSVDSIEKSAQIYNDSVVKSDMITRYMEGTSRLFMEHNNAIAILDNSLHSMEESIKHMRDALVSRGGKKTGTERPQK